MRLAQFISMAGYCSRRQASRLIDDNKVIVNGKLAGQLTFVSAIDHVMINAIVLTLAPTFVCYRYHKPIGIDCNLDINDADSLIHHLPKQETIRLFPIGRLDKDSCGLLLLTNDGPLANRLLSPAFKQPKRYEVIVVPSFENTQQGVTSLDDQFIEGMNTPMVIKGHHTQPCEIDITGALSYTITMTQGLNRQIRRMSANQGFKVVHLKRVNFACISLLGLAVGESERLSDESFSLL